MIRIATRRSALARAQSHQLGLVLSERTGEPFELVPLASSGDLHPERAVTDFETKGLFVDAVRQAVLDGEADIAVHSYKDLPSEPVDGLVVAAVPERADSRDVLVTRDGYGLSNLPSLAMVGTSSERRRLQLLRAKPSLQVLPIRGNLETRLRKVDDGQFDGVVVAFAGLRRLYTPPELGGVGALGLPLKAVPLEPGECLSAAGQGALAVECRTGDDATAGLLRHVHHPPSERQVRAERAYLARLGGGCLAPIGAGCGLTPLGGLELAGMLADPVGRRVLRGSRQGPYGEPERLGQELAEEMLAAGGEQLLAGVNEVRARTDAGEVGH